MAKSENGLLESIVKLVERDDAAALVALEDHEDKKVRKAARRGLHQLRSRAWRSRRRRRAAGRRGEPAAAAR
jgi:hypothetical protein